MSAAKPNRIRLNSITSLERHAAIDAAKEALTGGGAWLTDYRMYSNRSVCIQFELDIRDAGKLQTRLLDCGLALAAESLAGLQEAADYAERMPEGDEGFDIRGTFEVTFLHEEPDLIQDIPPFEL